MVFRKDLFVSFVFFVAFVIQRCRYQPIRFLAIVISCMFDVPS